MKTIKLLIVLVSITFLSLSLNAQNLATTIKVQAMDLGKSFIENEFNSFVKYMHPSIIKFAGGEEQMKTKMDSAYAAMKRFNVRVKKYWIGHPGEIITHKNQLQAVLPQSTTLITPFGELTAETSMIVVSGDGGKNWWFIDTNVYNVDKLKNVLPDLSPKLVIPPKKKPRLMPLQNNP